MQDTRPLRQRLMSRHSMLVSERSSWLPHWQDITRVLLPRGGRYFTSDRNQGGRNYNEILDNTATRALRVMAAGLMSGATSPARQWFRLAAPDPDMNRMHGVKVWLDDVAERMARVFRRSNTYRALHQCDEELGAFGTAGTIVLPHPDRIIHHYPMPVGSFCLAADAEGRINCTYRDYEMTVGQMVREFGMAQVSESVRRSWQEGRLEQWVPVVHAIEPRDDRDEQKRDALNMPYRSVWFEKGGADDRILRESGYELFPALCPRWATTGEDLYGNSPGMEALGDIRQLQHEQMRKAEAIDYQTKPPLQAPVRLSGQEINMLPGGATYVDAMGPDAGIRAAWETNLRLDYLLADVQDVRQRIAASFFQDLFLMLATAGPDTRMTATEVAERHEEKLLMIGPVLERLHNELLDPLISMTFRHMSDAGQLPPPPPELEGQELQVEFVSILAQAQRAVGAAAVDRFVGNLGAVAQIVPEVLDKFDADAWADHYSDVLGVDPRIVRSTEDVRELREARNQALAAKEQANMQQQQAATAVDAAAAMATQPPVDVMGALTGYGSPSPQAVQ